MIFLGGLMGVTVALVAFLLYMEHRAEKEAVERAARDAERARAKPKQRRRYTA